MELRTLWIVKIKLSHKLDRVLYWQLLSYGYKNCGKNKICKPFVWFEWKMRRATSLIFIIINVFLNYTTYQTLHVNYKLRYEVSVKYKKVETFVEIGNLTSSAFIEFQCEQSRPTD